MSEHDAPSAREWETALDRLELQVNRAERLGAVLDAKDPDLALPASLSTIPRYLLARAQSLVERQHRLANTLPVAEPEETPEEIPAQVSAETWEPAAVRGGTLHERVGHLISGPRPPVSIDLFDTVEGAEA